MKGGINPENSYFEVTGEARAELDTTKNKMGDFTCKCFWSRQTIGNLIKK